ncbi:hypothetical protein ASPACDRAFT_1857560 [Aspergillus aculeatus ATCC 16872]|uniref:Yeast cell wall synthesis Kre9/Knh1-like N-terminal domain-containing protein n=1 Tax=Aspergillus aculeatus (strain ATCC 16872 / CBS 172.66 / WB 5094) TaxID=690307 RepID=A0A1L9WPZ9_ASPA1|nr:uncharacterized protein ASPACDRAFT_1857560 [Aspergillus aculeatus ATCC 16872]OJJ98232.1 hypothetical protein ASPACDRAFT_1857560 [Aspergillus aculeatus ATCC 16872]
MPDTSRQSWIRQVNEMRASNSLVAAFACLAQIGIAEAALSFTQWPSVIHAGQPTTLKWQTDSDAPVTVTLRKGNSQNLDTVQTLASNAQGGSFTWIPDSTIENGDDYAFQIQQNGYVNYSGLLQVTDGSPATPATKAASIPVLKPSSTTLVASVIPPAHSPATPTANAYPTDTAPHDEMQTVQKGNDGQTFTVNAANDPSANAAGAANSKTAMAAYMQSGAASVRATGMGFVLGALAMVVYLV